MPKVKINIKPVEKAAVEAFRESAFLLGRKFTEVISEPGAFSGFEGDIVDTGELRASQRLEFKGKDEAQFSWSQEYALFVLLGYQLRDGRQQPGRDWTAEGLKRQNFQATFELLLKSKLS